MQSAEKVPQTALESLIEVRRLLMEKGWTQEDYAKDSYGQSVDCHSPKATAFCLLGALHRTRGRMAALEARVRLQARLLDKGWGGIVDFNDSRSTRFEDVINLLDEVIAEA